MCACERIHNIIHVHVHIIIYVHMNVYISTVHTMYMFMYMHVKYINMKTADNIVVISVHLQMHHTCMY